MALVVLLTGLVLVGIPVVRSETNLLSDDPFSARTTTETVTKKSSKGTETTVTVKAADDSVVERSLDDAGLLVLRIAVVVLAAFIAGAATQRVLLANYAVTVGDFQVPALQETAETSSRGLESIAQDLVELRGRVDQQAQDLVNAARYDAAISGQMAALARKVSELDAAQPRGGGTRP